MTNNTATRFGSVARVFHWTIAILVLSDISLGLLGKFTPRNGDTVDFLQLLYSTHKTIGVTVLALAVLRVIWAFMQPRPVPIHPHRHVENFVAETAHWLLYGAIFVLPLSGWMIHSAEVGFAPILWPFGQNLPFVPKSENLALLAANVHWIAGIVLAVTVAAHISGALKHVVIDRDGTLARMWRGTDAGDSATGHSKNWASVAVALVIWVVTIGGAVTVFAPTHEGELTLEIQAADITDNSGWVVQDGTVSIVIQQIGSQVSGSFGNWQATIAYDPDTGTGQVNAIIDTTSLTLGSVTTQAKGAEFFDVDNHGQAVFQGEIMQLDQLAHTASGTLTLIGQSVPVTLNFDLEVTDGLATMSGATVLDRRDFGIGTAYPDESSLGFSVDIAIELTAQLVE